MTTRKNCYIPVMQRQRNALGEILTLAEKKGSLKSAMVTTNPELRAAIERHLLPRTKFTEMILTKPAEEVAEQLMTTFKSKEAAIHFVNTMLASFRAASHGEIIENTAAREAKRKGLDYEETKGLLNHHFFNATTPLGDKLYLVKLKLQAKKL